jgi:hypothetical protein
MFCFAVSTIQFDVWILDTCYDNSFMLMILASIYLQLHIAVLIPMVMGRFLIDIYPTSPFTSIREEQGLNMELSCLPYL